MPSGYSYGSSTCPRFFEDVPANRPPSWIDQKVNAMRAFNPVSDTQIRARFAARLANSTLFMTMVAVSLSATAAIPLLGPCDPDFRNSGSCAPGTTKDEKSVVPAKPHKPAPPAQPAPANAPQKGGPAAKTPLDSRPEVTQVSLSAEENCPKSRVDLADDSQSPQVALSPLIGP